MKESTLKYNLHSAIGKLPRSAQGKAIRAICKELDISIATFRRYESFQLDDPADMRVSHLYKIAAMFNMKPDMLMNPTYLKGITSVPDIAQMINMPALSPYKAPPARRHKYITTYTLK